MEKLDVEFWRDVFEDLMEQVKPGDAWKLTMDRELDFHQVPSGWKRFLQKRICARFTCSQCRRSWTSHQAVILFHLHWDRSGRQGRVKMKHFDQQCHVCGLSEYEEPQFTEEAILSVLVLLVFAIRKKCYREHVEDWDLHEVVCQSGGGGPHKEDYCEACQLGIHKGHPETPQCSVYQGKTSPGEPHLTGHYTWSQGTVSIGTTLPRAAQDKGNSDAINEAVPGRAESPRDRVCHGKTSLWEPQHRGCSTESQNIKISGAIIEQKAFPWHSESLQDGVSHGETSPQMPPLAGHCTWLEGSVSHETTSARDSQATEIPDAISEGEATSERPLTASRRLRGSAKCYISCVGVAIIITAHIIVLVGFLKHWY